MPNTVFISFDDGEPPLNSLISESVLISFILNVLEKRGHSLWELSLFITNNSNIQKINKEYRNIDEPTDVLSFPMGEMYVDEKGLEHFIAGDIIISLDCVCENAKRFSTSFNEELKRMIIHSILHLEGMDHSTNEMNEPMLLLQEEILIHFENFKIIKNGN